LRCESNTNCSCHQLIHPKQRKRRVVPRPTRAGGGTWPHS